MRRLLFYSLLLVLTGMSAQTTHNLDWFMGISQAEASIEIDEGDTVIWTFTDAAPHSVTSDAGSAETFDSGTLNAGSTYSHTFTEPGESPYHCIVHPAMMGIITVNTLGVDEKSIRDFSLAPNPVSAELQLSLPNMVENARITVYNILGEMILKQRISTLHTEIHIAGWSDGIYLVQVGNGKTSTTKRLVKN